MGENDRSECVGSFALHQVGTKSRPRWMYHSGALTEKRGNKILNWGGGGSWSAAPIHYFQIDFYRAFLPGMLERKAGKVVFISR